MFNTRSAGATDIGLKRENNEDTFLHAANLGLYIVADGMGGHASGEVASKLAVEVISDKVQQGMQLKAAILAAHQVIISTAEKDATHHGMGSTLVALKESELDYEIAWVGDSRAYLYNPASDKATSELHQLTTDHSYVQLLLQNGAIDESELNSHPEKSVITQCLGFSQAAHINIDSVAGEWHQGKRILLCSDGLSDVLSKEKLLLILEQQQNNKKCCQALIQAALDAGSHDNITVMLINAPVDKRCFWSWSR
ncbi:PP2C family serine/threonine-protein phosphatase [Agaribacterium sp. ZY112]|uniref:PP2C family protein-serine/threonine phosphatase n=1 Tax=Agaribacterium sp. ZY112 TaxID=3233574 RepID=UPI003523350E